MMLRPRVENGEPGSDLPLPLSSMQIVASLLLSCDLDYCLCRYAFTLGDTNWRLYYEPRPTEAPCPFPIPRDPSEPKAQPEPSPNPGAWPMMFSPMRFCLALALCIFSAMVNAPLSIAKDMKSPLCFPKFVEMWANKATKGISDLFCQDKSGAVLHCDATSPLGKTAYELKARASGIFSKIYKMLPTQEKGPPKRSGLRFVAKVPKELNNSWFTKELVDMSGNFCSAEVKKEHLFFKEVMGSSRAIQERIDKKLEERVTESQEPDDVPKNVAWKEGQIPVCTILDMVISSELRACLIKPELEGTCLSDEPRKGKKFKLTREKGRELDNLNLFIAAVQEGVPASEDYREKVIIDNNPNNIWWIENKKVLEFLGLKRPTFILVELTPMAYKYQPSQNEWVDIEEDTKSKNRKRSR